MDVSRSHSKPNYTSRTEFFGARLDQYLPTLQSDHARRVFLTRQREVFREQYGKFIATSGASAKLDPVFGWPTAADFLETISDIDRRISDLRSAGRAAA